MMLREMPGISGLRMKEKLFILVLVCVGISLLAASSALAGEYHTGASLVCMQCHTMHYSQQHDYSGNPGSGSPTSTPPQATLDTSDGPYEKLLRDAGSALCLSCHDGQTFAPDVLGVQTATVAHARQAGGLNDSTTVGDGYSAYTGHTLGTEGHAPGYDSIGTPGETCKKCHMSSQGGGGGGGPDLGNSRISPLGCISCHEPHGAPSYRNLAAIEANGTARMVTYAKDTNVSTEDVFLRGWTEGDIDGNYSVANVDFNEPFENASALAKLCSLCHGAFHGEAGDSHMGGSDGTEWLRHPTADANIGAVTDDTHSSGDQYKTGAGGKTNWVKVMSPDGEWGGAVTVVTDATNETPSCMTCHKSHGNQNAFGLIYMAETGTVTEEGTATGTYTDLCHQCHIQGVP